MVVETKLERRLQLSEEYVLRPATLDDIEATVALVNVCSVAAIGKSEAEAQEFRNDWQSPQLDPARDLRVVEHNDGTVVGYCGVWDAEPHVRLYSWSHVHPEHRGEGIGAALLNWLEARARASVAQAPEGTRVALLHDAKDAEAEPEKHALLEAQDYRLVRYFFRMLIEMDAPPPEPVWAEGISVRTFDREQDFREVVTVGHEAFRDHWGYVEQPLEQELVEWAHWIDNDEHHTPTVWFLPTDGERIVALCLCTPQLPEDPEQAYVMSLAVMPEWRRKGIGLAMLQHTFGEFYRRGICKVSLDVDAESLTGALRLYERAGMHVLRRSCSFEKELRPGVELSTVSLK